MSLENLPKSDAPPLEIHDLTVAYRNKPVLWGIDLVAPAGKLIGIVGPNGAGKSTLIKACMGLLPCSSGWVNAFGRPVAQSLGRVGYVPQRESVDWDFPVSVMDVVLMGHEQMWNAMRERDAIYNNAEASEEDFLRAADLEAKYAEYGGNDGDSPAKVFHWSLLSAVLRGLTRGNRSLDQPTGWGLKATALATRGQTPRGAP